MHQRIDIISLLYFEQADQFPLRETGCQACAFVHCCLWSWGIEVVEQAQEGATGTVFRQSSLPLSQSASICCGQRQFLLNFRGVRRCD